MTLGRCKKKDTREKKYPGQGRDQDGYAFRAEARPAGADAASRREEARAILVDLLAQYLLARQEAAANGKRKAA